MISVLEFSLTTSSIIGYFPISLAFASTLLGLWIDLASKIIGGKIGEVLFINYRGLLFIFSFLLSSR